MSFRFASVLLALVSCGCATDLGLGLGSTLKDPHGVVLARAAASTRIGTSRKDRGFLLGTALEGRAEWELGSRWNAGIMAGWGSGPATLGGKVGGELYAEAGVPLAERLLSDEAYYAGLAAALPISLEPTRSITDMNRAMWILRRRVELVPQARYRLYSSGEDSVAPAYQHELAVLLSFRLRFESDLY